MYKLSLVLLAIVSSILGKAEKKYTIAQTAMFDQLIKLK